MSHTILILDRGEAAQRVARTCRRLGHKSVLLVDAIADPNAALVELDVEACDEVVEAADRTPESVLAAADRAGADAVHFGYAPLRIQVELAPRLTSSGLALVGISPDAFELTRSRARVREAAREHVARVPESSLALTTRSDILTSADIIGFPLAVRSDDPDVTSVFVAEDEDELADVLQKEWDEGMPVILERHVERARHVTVTVFATETTQVAIGEYEHSIRADYRTWLAECPAPAVAGMTHPEAYREAIAETAARVAGAIKGRGLIDIEFTLDGEGKFWLYDVHIGARPEHALLEMTLGTDLLEAELSLAFADAPPQSMTGLATGHAVLALLTAEPVPRDPDSNIPESAPNVMTFVRVDTPPAAVAAIHVEYPNTPGTTQPVYDAKAHAARRTDDVLARLFIAGSTRHATLLLLDRVLAEAKVPTVQSNVQVLRRVLAHEAFRAGQYDESFLRRAVAHQPSLPPAPRG